MPHVKEKLPALTGDLVWWDGKAHQVDEDGKTVAGHPYVAFSRKDDFEHGHGYYMRPSHMVPAGEAAAVPVVEGDAVITLADGQLIVMPADQAHASFDIERDEGASKSRVSTKKLPEPKDSKVLPKDGEK